MLDITLGALSPVEGYSRYPPPPTPIKPGGTYGHFRSPEPPISGKGYTPYLRNWLLLAITKKKNLFGLSQEIFPKK